MSSISCTGGTTSYQAPQTAAAISQQAAKREVANAKQAAAQATSPKGKGNDGDADDAGGVNILA